MEAYDLNRFINGATFMGEVAIALLFFRYWVRTADRLFVWFATAFALFAVERIFLLWTLHGDTLPAVYITRLLAFGCIIFAVIERNRRGA